MSENEYGNGSVATTVRTRKALNDLKYSPNRKDAVDISPRKLSSASMIGKRGLQMFDMDNFKKVNNQLKRKTSISLPDICSIDASIKKNNSTPLKQIPKSGKTPSKSITNTPSKHATFNRKQNISIIFEEKENPNVAFNLKVEKCLNEVAKIREEKSEKEFKEISIQCNKVNEDMLFSDSVDNTPYWKDIAHKRYKYLLETEEENRKLHEIILDLDKKNSVLREKNEGLNKILNDFEEIRKMMLESTQNDDEVDDSGYDVSHA